MRITDAYTKVAEQTTTSVGTAKAADAKAAKTKEANAAAAKDSVTVNLSEKARELAAQAPTDFDQAKVDRLTDAVQGGTFLIDTRAIAERLVGGDS